MKKHTLQTFMWENHFKAIYASIPHNRRDAKTVEVMKKLIKEMWVAGYSASSIGRFLDKDHSTVLHHLKFESEDKRVKRPAKDLSVVLAESRERTRKQRETQLLREQLKVELEERRKLLKKQREQKHKDRLERERLKNEAWEETRKKADSIRQGVFEMYKAGESYRDIRLKYNLSSHRVQGLLLYHPDYRKVMRPRFYNLGRKVIQYTKDGKKVAIHETMIGAAKKIGIPRGSISMVCRGRIPSSGGFVWKYADAVKI